MKHLSQIAFAVFLMVTAGSAFAEDVPSATLATGQPEQRSREQTVASPVQMVRTLHLMQDQIASGSIEAHQSQRGLLAILDERFMSFEPETWRDRRNVQAAVAFVLSGGKPQVLRRILSLGSAFASAEDMPLLEGALAYVEGREEEAGKVLLAIDVRTLPATLSGQIALVQSALIVRTDPGKSVELLDFVRLQAPGTLLEEAALRRQVFVTSQINDARKFESLVGQYLHRYQHSIYAGNFRQRLASALTRIDFGKDNARFERMASIMDELDPEVRRELYLLAAQASVEQGLTKSALLLAERAQELSAHDPQSSARAKLYRAAAMIVSPEALDTAVKDLQSLDRSILGDSDAALVASALAMADQIRRGPEDPLKGHVAALKPASDAPAPVDMLPPVKAQASEQPAAVLKARDALSRVDNLIKAEPR